MKYNINDLKIIVNDKILDDIRKYYCFYEIMKQVEFYLESLIKKIEL